MSVSDRQRQFIFAVTAILAFLVSLTSRVIAPSDLWDQTQPRTISYTADMVSRGGEAWILARDADGIRATKPPLYNWLAAPAVVLAGRSNEFAHKLPSVLASIGVIALLVVVGERMRCSLGWLAALMWIACYATFKLEYLARPDMLLSLLLFAGWIAAARLLAPCEAPRASGRWAFLFWTACILAAWTKGPVCVLLPAFAVLATLVAHRTLAPLWRLRPVLGLLAFILLAPAWYAAAACIDLSHLTTRLWNDEVFGRVTGLGTEGGQRGILGILRGLPLMPFYFVARFAPWSIVVILGALALLDRHGVRRWRQVPHGRSLLFALVWCVLLIAAFSLSSGKRADYIAPAFAPAALLAAWWLLEDRLSPLRKGGTWVVPTIAVVVLAAMIVNDQRGPVLHAATTRRFDEVTDRIRALDRDRPLVVLVPQLPHLASLLADPPPFQNTPEFVDASLANGQGVLVLVADYDLRLRIPELIEHGSAQLLWTIDHTDEAKAWGFPAPIRLLSFEGHAEPIGPVERSSPRVPTSPSASAAN